MRKVGLRVVVLLSAASWLGCLYPDDFEDTASTSSYSVEQGWLAGDVPTVGRFEADAYHVEATSRSVTVHTGARGGDHAGWAMTRIRLDLDDVASATGALAVAPDSATGCSGPRHDDFTWDDSSRSARVWVEPGASENERLVSFETTYDGGHQTRGGFTVRIH